MSRRGGPFFSTCFLKTILFFIIFKKFKAPVLKVLPFFQIEIDQQVAFWLLTEEHRLPLRAGEMKISHFKNGKESLSVNKS